MFRRPVGDHILSECLVFCVLLLLLRQQSGVLFGKLGHLRDGLAAQGVKGFLCRLMLGDLVPMLGKKFLLVAGLFISGIDLPRFGVVDDMGLEYAGEQAHFIIAVRAFALLA